MGHPLTPESGPTWRLYRRRYLVEIFFHHLKRFGVVATRYDKTDQNYLAIVQVACATRWLN